MSTVLVDALFFTGSRGGMESYLRNLYTHLPPSDFEFVAFGSREFAASDTSWFPGDVIDSGISGARRGSWAIGELTAVGAAARRHGASLIHAPANVGPWTARTPVALTIHDLLPFRRPDLVPGPYAPALRMLVRKAANRARLVLTISAQTASDIVGVLGVPEENIQVIPLAGSADDKHPLPRGPREADLLLALGNRLPHKNFPALVEALALIDPTVRPHLVVTGGSQTDPLEPLVRKLGLEPWVELRGWVDEEEVAALYARAAAVVVPSLFEGFGLPVLEAMARECPVICSDLPVLREVAADAAVFFDPVDTSSIARTLQETLADPLLLRNLGQAGARRAATFSWDRTAAATLQAFGRALA